jgi:hypothetical protein
MREYDAEPKAVIAALRDRSMANKVLALSTLISFGMSTKTLSVVEMPTPKAASRQPRAKNGERGEALMKFMRSNKRQLFQPSWLRPAFLGQQSRSG